MELHLDLLQLLSYLGFDFKLIPVAVIPEQPLQYGVYAVAVT